MSVFAIKKTDIYIYHSKISDICICHFEFKLVYVKIDFDYAIKILI